MLEAMTATQAVDPATVATLAALGFGILAALIAKLNLR